MRRDLADLTSFIMIAEEQSFRRAAERLGLTPSALSHKLRQFEERAGTRLVHRTTRSVTLTGAGQRLLDQARPAMAQIEEALENLHRERSEPSGTLRIYASHEASTAVMAPIWRHFTSTYPAVHLDVEVGETPIDFIARGFDAALWSKSRVSSDMVAIRVTGPIKMALVASPSILVDRAVPQMPEDLLHFDCVQYRRGEDKNPVPWHFERGGERREVVVRGPVTVTLPELAVRAALDGLGVAYVSENYANIPNRSGGLIRLLEDWSPITDGLYLCYPWQRQAPAALRSFKELLLLHMIDP